LAEERETAAMPKDPTGIEIDSQSLASPDTSQKSDTAPKDQAISRLRESKSAFLEKTLDDARESGATWILEIASYEQIKYLLYCVKPEGKRQALQDPVEKGPLASMPDLLEGLSNLPKWARTPEWYDEFLSASTRTWREILERVEADP
jgi:hypothetical protein